MRVPWNHPIMSEEDYKETRRCDIKIYDKGLYTFLKDQAYPSYDQLKTWVGGFIEPLVLKRHTEIYVNEDGIALKLFVNQAFAMDYDLKMTDVYGPVVVITFNNKFI